MGELYLEAINSIELELASRKCNALIGTRCDFDEVSGKGTLMFMLTVTGTAVNVLKTNEMAVQSPILAIANGKRLERKLKDRPNIHTVCQIIDELLANLYLVDLELLIKAIAQNSDVNETLDKNQIAKIISYLNTVFDKKDVSRVLINSLKENKTNEAFDFVYMQFALPYFETMTDVLDSLNKQTIEKYIRSLENKPRADYRREDAEAIDKYMIKLADIGFDLNYSSEDEYLARMYGIKSKKDTSFINDLKDAIVQHYSQQELCQ